MIFRLLIVLLIVPFYFLVCFLSLPAFIVWGYLDNSAVNTFFAAIRGKAELKAMLFVRGSG